jgi:coenzyme F420-reducing hydrogenase delta subunit
MFSARRIEYVKTLLAKLKIDPARLEMYNLSAAMGPKWAEICTQFTGKIRRLGPSPIGLALAKRKAKE